MSRPTACVVIYKINPSSFPDLKPAHSEDTNRNYTKNRPPSHNKNGQESLILPVF